jgi:hypothetical protein
VKVLYQIILPPNEEMMARVSWRVVCWLLLYIAIYMIIQDIERRPPKNGDRGSASCHRLCEKGKIEKTMVEESGII